MSSSAKELTDLELARRFIAALRSPAASSFDLARLGLDPALTPAQLAKILARLLSLDSEPETGGNPPEPEAAVPVSAANHYEHVILRTDGAARGNPGPAAAGVVLHDGQGQLILQFGRYLGEATNNTAEYQALLLGLEAALRHTSGSLELRMDSELIVRQLQGRYQVKSPHLKPLHKRAVDLLKNFKAVNIKHVPREMNAQADALANQALDQA